MIHKINLKPFKQLILIEILTALNMDAIISAEISGTLSDQSNDTLSRTLRANLRYSPCYSYLKFHGKRNQILRFTRSTTRLLRE